MISETALIIYFSNQIEDKLPRYIAAVDRELKSKFRAAIIDTTPSYTSLLIEYHPLKVNAASLQDAISNILNQLTLPAQELSTRIIELPTYYSLESGPDLAKLSSQTGLSIEQIYAIHAQTSYTVYAIGFAPGFAFLASVDPLIQCPRHASPRATVPAGSVGIANQQTAVYPAQSPGGWNIIGNCPISLFDPLATPSSPFKVGDQVRFKAISKTEFLSLGGQICTHWK